MIYLILSVVSSTIILMVFRWFERFGIDRLQGIVVNYIVACLCGLIAFEGSINPSQIIDKTWFLPTLGLGALFIIIFNLMALTTQRAGLSVTSVAVKMSLVVPILFGLLFYKESAGWIKLLGILIALAAVYLSSVKKDSAASKSYAIWLPLLVFLGSGVIDTSLKYLEDSYVGANEVPLFSSMIFASAAIIGIIYVGYRYSKGRTKIKIKNIWGGIALGIPNYFSVYFLVQALRIPSLDSSTVFTINNVAVVLVSTIIGILLFKEVLSKKNWLGIILAVVSISLVALSV